MDRYYDWQQSRRVRDIVDAEPDVLRRAPETGQAVSDALSALEFTGSNSAITNPVAGCKSEFSPEHGGKVLRVFVDIQIEPALSLRRFFEFLRPKLEVQGIQFVAERASADIQWDPYGGWTYAPPTSDDLPFVSTFHGAMGWFAPWDWEYTDPQSALEHQVYALRQYMQWKRFGDRVTTFIVPSFFAGRELCETLGVDADRIAVVHHGVDPAVFCPDGPREAGVGFLHIVAHWRVKKNIERIIAAHQLSGVSQPLTVIANSWDAKGLPAGVHHVPGPVSATRVAEYYRGAQALVFATLSETFGLPALEAMSSGCPVIVGRGTATEELFGSTALVVDPFSVTDIAGAMGCMTDPAVIADYRQRGLLRAQSFSWERTAQAHRRIFQKAVWEHRLLENPKRRPRHFWTRWLEER